MFNLTAFWFVYKQFVDSLHETDFKLVSFDIETNPAITAKFKNVYSAQFTAYAAHLLHAIDPDFFIRFDPC